MRLWVFVAFSHSIAGCGWAPSPKPHADPAVFETAAGAAVIDAMLDLSHVRLGGKSVPHVIVFGPVIRGKASPSASKEFLQLFKGREIDFIHPDSLKVDQFSSTVVTAKDGVLPAFIQLASLEDKGNGLFHIEAAWNHSVDVIRKQFAVQLDKKRQVSEFRELARKNAQNPSQR